MLPEEVNKLIGQAGEVVMMEVERGAIKKYANAVADFNPLYWDEEAACQTRYGGLIAPPGFFGWPVYWKGNFPTVTPLVEKLISVMAQAGFPRLLDGGAEFEFFAPVRAGDILAALPRIVSITERESKGGRMIFSTYETTYTGMNGRPVARVLQTFIHR